MDAAAGRPNSLVTQTTVVLLLRILIPKTPGCVVEPVFLTTPRAPVSHPGSGSAGVDIHRVSGEAGQIRRWNNYSLI